MVAELVSAAKGSLYSYVMRNKNEIYKTLLPYMGTRLRCQDAWPSFLWEYTSFAFGSTDTWRQLAGYTFGFKVMGIILRSILQLCE